LQYRERALRPVFEDGYESLLEKHDFVTSAARLCNGLTIDCEIHGVD